MPALPPATFLLVPLAEPGHLNPALRIARELRSHGHRIVVCGIEDLEEPVRAQGLDFEPVFSRLTPRGQWAAIKRRLSQLSGGERRRYEKQVDALVDQVRLAVLGGEYDRVLERVRPDLVLSDAMMFEPALAAHGHGLATVLLNTTLPLHHEPGVPLLGSWLLPDGRWSTRARIGLEQFMAEAGLVAERTLRSRDARYLKQLLAHYRLPRTQLDQDLIPPVPWLPELVLCPPELDLFGSPRRRGHFLYADASIDLQRREPPFPWERLAEGAPLVYVSLGTLAFLSQRAAPLFQAAVGAAALRPNWQFVLAVGEALDPASLDGAHPNVIAVRQAPQLSLLRRATAMVTHAGFNSVKECIHFAVPMIALPLQYDQPGIAARVAFHKLGVRLPPQQASAARLAAALDTVRNTLVYRQALLDMQARFRRAETEAPASRLLERLLPARRS